VLHYSFGEAWPLLCGLLVFLMIPGLGLVGSGIVRIKNSLSQLIQVLLVIPFSTFLFSIIGFSLIFSESSSSLIGGFDFILLQGIDQTSFGDVAGQSFFFFQLTFFILANALLVGVVGERVKLKKILLFCFLWSILVYCPVAYWAWGANGWIKSLGGLDFAGGIVVHITTGFSALALTLVLKRRADYFKLIEKYNNGFIFLGTFLIWIGWFGFNAGSSFVFNESSVSAIVNTFMASSASLLIWFLIDLFHTPHQSYLSHLGMGVIAGLVSITPGAGYVSMQSAFILGAVAGFLGNYSVRFMHKVFNQDDVLEVFSTHGICGLWGCVGLALFIPESAGVVGLKVFKANTLGTTVVALYSLLITCFIIFVLGGAKNFVVSNKEEDSGLDLLDHGEKAINLEGR
jgi:Amt family ammonium transporter